MKSTGMVRRIDELGRIVVPSEIRQTLGIQLKDSIEIFVEDDRIILQKYQPSCVFCKETADLVYYGEKRVCRACIEKLEKLK